MEEMSAERYKELYGSKPKSKIDQPSESAEQISLFQWVNFASGQYPCLDLMYHVPNGGKRDKATAGRLKAEGVRAGVPDICLPVPSKNYHGLYIELKIKSGKPSTLQRQWLNNLSSQGYMAAICYGWEDAKDTILNYLRGAG